MAEVIKGCRARLTGTITLESLLELHVQAGRELTQDRIANLVSDNEPAIRPPPLVRGFASKPFATGEAFELRYANAADLARWLQSALKNLPDQPAQIRTPDGARRFDLYPHEGGGLTVIDQASGNALDVGRPVSTDAVLIDALGVQANDTGALIVSYGNQPEVMFDNARFHWTREQILQGHKTPMEQRIPISDMASNALHQRVAR